MTHPSRHRRRTKLQSWYVWHRWIGVSSALLVLVLAVTGVLLNHTDTLDLDKRQVRTEALLAWYGIDTPNRLPSFDLHGARLTQVGERWFLGDQALAGEFPALRGALDIHGLVIAASADTLWLFDAHGELVERMDQRAGVPKGIHRIGIDAQDRVMIEARSGYYRGDSDLVRWERAAAPARAQWAGPTQLPAPLRERILHRYRGTGLSVERVLLDLHSGRILGGWGVYLMDAAAVSLVLLACSGVWLWLRGRLRRRSG